MRRIALLTLAFCSLVPAQSGDAEKLAPYYPTPETIVDKMLQLGGLKAGEKVYDLGSGDGRIIVMAAQKFHADAVGIELDKDLCKLSEDKIRKLHLEKNAHIVMAICSSRTTVQPTWLLYTFCRDLSTRSNPCSICN
jgi:tRNA G46 methylase TrmB